MILTHKTECFPTNEQKEFFERCFGMRRFYFNKAIMTLKGRYGDLKENIKSIKSKEVMSLRKDVFLQHYRSLKLTVPDHILYTSMEDVIFALNSLRKKGKVIKLRKKKASNTFRICRSGDGVTFRYKNGSKYIKLPQFDKYNLSGLKMAESLRWNIKDTTIRTVTIKKFAGRYFISIVCELDDLPLNVNQNRHIGIDWGLKKYITGYDGTNIIEDDFNEITLKRLDKRIAIHQKSLSRKKMNSNNWLKAKTKLQQAYLNFNNYRHEYVNSIVNIINQEYDSVTLEDLGMAFVTRNKHLAHRARQKPFYLLKVKLINKFHQTGKKVYVVPRSYPSTQTCNACGHVKTGDEKMKLGDHIYHCNACGHEDDRDHNAAKNLYSYRNLEEAQLED
jgi:putative transposase